MKVPREAIAELVEQLAGVACVWADDAQGELGANEGPAAWIKITPTGSVQKGGAEYRSRTSETNPNATEGYVYAYELMTVTLRAESMERGTQAYELLRRVRAGLRTLTAKAVYQDHRIAFVRTRPIACSSAGPQNRRRLIASMDWTFAILGGGAATDDDGQTIGQINGGGPVPFTPS